MSGDLEHVGSILGRMKTVDDAALEAGFSAVKGAIGCERVAEEETALRRVGAHLRGRCPLPDHEDRTPSFCVYPDERGFCPSWWCFGCNRGGDVVDLWDAMRGPFRHSVDAMHDLAEHFGLKLRRPEDLMSESQLAARKARLRAERMFADAVAKHVFERRVMPLVEAVEDERERAALLKECVRLAGIGGRGA